MAGKAFFKGPIGWCRVNAACSNHHGQQRNKTNIKSASVLPHNQCHSISSNGNDLGNPFLSLLTRTS
jgi:hypothetical protein